MKVNSVSIPYHHIGYPGFKRETLYFKFINIKIFHYSQCFAGKSFFIQFIKNNDPTLAYPGAYSPKFAKNVVWCTPYMLRATPSAIAAACSPTLAPPPIKPRKR